MKYMQSSLHINHIPLPKVIVVIICDIELVMTGIAFSKIYWKRAIPVISRWVYYTLQYHIHVSSLLSRQYLNSAAGLHYDNYQKELIKTDYCIYCIKIAHGNKIFSGGCFTLILIHGVEKYPVCLHEHSDFFWQFQFLFKG